MHNMSLRCTIFNGTMFWESICRHLLWYVFSCFCNVFYGCGYTSLVMSNTTNNIHHLSLYKHVILQKLWIQHMSDIWAQLRYLYKVYNYKCVILQSHIALNSSATLHILSSMIALGWPVSDHRFWWLAILDLNVQFEAIKGIKEITNLLQELPHILVTCKAALSHES